MIHPAVKVLPVALSVSLVASCFLPCYTLAYADDAGTSDDSGAAPSDGQGSPVVYDVEPSPDFPLVESGDGGSDDSYGGFGEDVDGDSFYSDNDSGSFDSYTGGDSPTVNYDDQVTSYAANALDTMLNAALSQLGAEFGSSLWNNITGYTDTSITRINMVMNADTRLILYKRLPNIERSIDYLETVADDIANRLYSLQQKNDTLISVLRQQWGYNYGTGNTVVVHANSPAGWLQSLRDYNKEEYYDGYVYSTAKYLAFIFRENERLNSKLNYNGSLVGSDAGDYSAARLLARIHNGLYGNITYAETGNGGVRSAVSVLGYIANLVYYGNRDTSALLARNTYQGGLVGVDGVDTYGTARLLARIHNGLYGSITYSETGNTGVRSAISVLGYIANLVYQGDQYLSSVATRLHYIGPLSGVDGEGDYSVARLLARIHNYNHSIYSLLESMAGDSSSSVDLSETNRLLGRLTADVAGIRDKIVLQDSLSDLLDLLVGDMQVPQTQAAISRIQDVMSTRFPFCIPSVVNVVLFGSLLADPAPPVWTFDVGGFPLVVDFADYGAFAEVSSWTVRLLFTAALLLNTRRFVYGVGGGD